MNGISFRHVGKLVRKLNIRDGDILLIKQDTALANMDAIKNIADEIGKIRADILILVVDDLRDIEKLDADVLYKHGWVKLNSLAELFQRQNKETKDARKDDAAPEPVQE